MAFRLYVAVSHISESEKDLRCLSERRESFSELVRLDVWTQVADEDVIVT